MGFSATRSIKADVPECPAFIFMEVSWRDSGLAVSPKVTVSLGFFETRMESMVGRPLDLA